MKGRHFGFLCLLCASWVTTRVVVGSIVPGGISRRATSIASTVAPDALLASDVRYDAAPVKSGIKCCAKAKITFVSGKPPRPLPRKQLSFLELRFASPPPPETAAAVPSMATAGPAFWVRPRPPNANIRRWQIYAYSFWRNDADVRPLGFSQYGGGQSGVIATYAIAPQLSLLLRGTVAHDTVREREVAAGLRWSPPHFRNFTLTAERRVRNARNDAFAFYVAGGKSAVPLPLKFRLDAYGQAGYVGGNDGGAFFDAQARASQDIASLGDMPLKFGGGIWAGGQVGVARLDIGPTFGTDIRLGAANIRIDADWRFRIAGDARPSSGPALTLSTSF